MKLETLALLLILLSSMSSCTETEIYDGDDEMYRFRAYISQADNIVSKITNYRSRYVTYEVRYKTAYLTFVAEPETTELILKEHSHDWRKATRSVWFKKYDFEPMWWPGSARLDSIPMWGNKAVYFWYENRSHTAYVIYHND